MTVLRLLPLPRIPKAGRRPEPGATSARGRRYLLRRRPLDPTLVDDITQEDIDAALDMLSEEWGVAL